MRNRFRTGITLAMFTLVVFTLVVGAAVSGSFTRAFSDVETFGGGWDVRATASAVVPLRDPNAAVANSAVLDGSRYEQSAAMSFLPVQARQLGTSQRFEDYPVRGVDEAFAARTTYRFGAKARGYPDPWRALASEPGLAVVDSFAVARLDDFTVGAVLPEFQLEGFYLEDGVFDPVQVAVRDPKTGRTVELEVIGVLTDAAPYDAVGGITTSQATLEAAFGDRVQPTIFFFALAPGVDPRVEAGLLESTFLRNGLEADALEEVLEDAMATSSSFNRVIQGFMGLGLVVGVAALGVISARAVVERRQQIGILRAIGFRRRMIQLSFLLESSFIALTAIASGTALGLVCSRNIVADVASQPSYEHLTLSVPWLDLAIVFAVVYVVALATTLAPAVRASRIYPAQALRYQ